MTDSKSANWIKDKMQKWRDDDLTDAEITALLAGVTNIIMQNLVEAKAATQEVLAKRGVHVE